MFDFLFFSNDENISLKDDFEEHLKQSFLDVFSNVAFCNAEKIGNIITRVQNLKSIRAPSTAGKESLCCGFG